MVKFRYRHDTWFFFFYNRSLPPMPCPNFVTPCHALCALSAVQGKSFFLPLPCLLCSIGTGSDIYKPWEFLFMSQWPNFNQGTQLLNKVYTSEFHIYYPWVFLKVLIFTGPLLLLPPSCSPELQPRQEWSFDLSIDQLRFHITAWSTSLYRLCLERSHSPGINLTKYSLDNFYSGAIVGVIKSRRYSPDFLHLQSS